MKIYRNQYDGWSTTAHSKTKDGEPIKCYMDVSFKKGEEPLVELNGDLVLKCEDGTERHCFLSSYMKQGVAIPKLVVMKQKVNPEVNYQTRLNDGHHDVLGHRVDNEVKIEEKDLPFY